MNDYNGWANKQTWLTNLWLGDSMQGCQDINPELIRGLVLEQLGYGDGGLKDDAALLFVDSIDLNELAEAWGSA